MTPRESFLTILLTFSAATAYALDADELVRDADEGRVPPGAIVFISHVEDYEDGRLERESSFKVLNKDRQASLVETLQPERQRGRKLLMDNDNLWYYTPDLRKPARVSLQQRLTGEVANGDLARTNFSGDYSARLVGRDKINGRDTYKLELAAKQKSVTYSRIDYWISVQGRLPVKAVFYAVSGKVLKTAEYTGVKNVLGKKCVTKTVFVDALDKGKKSVLTYSSHRPGRFPASVFNKEGLSE